VKDFEHGKTRKQFGHNLVQRRITKERGREPRRINNEKENEK